MSSEKTEKPPGKKKSKLLLPLLLVLVLLGGGFAAYTFFLGGQATAPQETVGPLLIHRPKEFTVNLSDKAQRRFLKATIALGYADKGMGRELEQRSVQIRDLIITVLRSFSTAEMATAEGIVELRVKLIQELNAMLTSGEIKEIYFSELLVQ